MKLSLYNLRKGFRYLKNYGLKEFFIRLKEKGLDIRFCDNIRSFKKVFYTAREFENCLLYTSDAADD